MIVQGRYEDKWPGVLPSPFVNAWLSIDDVLPEPQEVDFFIDTGTSSTALNRPDIDRLGINFDAIPGKARPAFGLGEAPCKFADARLWLPVGEPTDERVYLLYDIELALIYGKQLDIPPPSLLGRNILNQCVCTFDAAKGRVTLDHPELGA